MRIPETETDRLLREAGYDQISEYREAVSLAGFDQKSQVLDVGTGSGRLAAALSEAGYQVVSGDIDPETLKRARGNLNDAGAENVILFSLDAGNISFADNSFSSVACANAIHHMTDPSKVISEMSRVSEPGGKLMIIEFNETGYEMINRIHTIRGLGAHTEGALSSDEIESQLKERFRSVIRHTMRLNNVWIASEKNSQVKTD